MKEFYDAANNRILCFEEAASPDFWDDLWLKSASSLRLIPSPHSRVVRRTSQYLPQNSRILEGGCGLSQQAYALCQAGYNCIGVDFAEKTLAFVKEKAPELNLLAADLRSLPFDDNLFDGYWSLGVIEHFPEGFDPLAEEMIRVIRPGGYLFLTFPTISPFCKLKAWLGRYPDIANKNGDLTGFYQFKFNPDQIAEHFQNLGFKVLNKSMFDATKGLKDEVAFLNPILQKFYISQNLCVRVVRKLFDLCFSPIFGHLSFIILQKEN